jgi:predicted NUDIX family NTP pyrophosphohydrolase
MAAKLSAGLLPFRRGTPFEVLVAHPGGPFWADKDAGHWSIIKGEVHEGEDPIDAAIREFAEETGWNAPEGGWIDLGEVTLRSGKRVIAWAVEADLDPTQLIPGTFSMFWHGRHQRFPEIDLVRWCDPSEANRLLNPAQTAFVERLLRLT